MNTSRITALCALGVLGSIGVAMWGDPPATQGAGLLASVLGAMLVALIYRILQEQRLNRLNPAPPSALMLRVASAMLYTAGLYAALGATSAPHWLRIAVGLAALALLAGQLLTAIAGAMSPPPPTVWACQKGLVETTPEGTLLLPWVAIRSVDLALLGFSPVLRVFIRVDEGFQVISGPLAAEEELAWMHRRSQLMEHTMTWSAAPIGYREGRVDASIVALYAAMQRGLTPNEANALSARMELPPAPARSGST